MRRHVSDVEYHTWFVNVKQLGVRDGELILGLRNAFAQDWFRAHYQELIERGLRQLGAQAPKVSFQVLPVVQEALLGNDASYPSDGLTSVADSAETASNRLNPRYTFRNFIVGANNNLAHAAAMAVAEAPGRAYNPLFIYGDVGLGKTHLMHAIWHSVASRSSEVRVEYVSTESFTNEMINAIRDDRMASFRNRYRSIDLLLVDDIQFLAGKEGTQEEFFHTFNALHENHKQIVLSSDRPPRDIQPLESRLRSRFEWGLITDIQKPGFETRVAILKMNTERQQVVVEQEVLELIARQITSNIRELEGALMRVIAYASLNNLELNRNTASRALSEVFFTQEEKLEIEDILLAVGDHFGVTEELLKASGRAKEIVIPRQIAMYLARTLTSYSLPEIGQVFHRDHSTVIYSIQKVTDQLQHDEETIRIVSQIKHRLNTRQE